jgi:hypothetical protein
MVAYFEARGLVQTVETRLNRNRVFDEMGQDLNQGEALRILKFFVPFIALGIAVPAVAIPSRTREVIKTDGLLLESVVSFEESSARSRVLLEAGGVRWVKVAEISVRNPKIRAAASAGHKPHEDGEESFVVEARATMLDAEVAEVETRIRGKKYEETGKLLVRFGEYGEITTAQMETVSGDKPYMKNGFDKMPTKFGVRVVRVRF